MVQRRNTPENQYESAHEDEVIFPRPPEINLNGCRSFFFRNRESALEILEFLSQNG